MYHTINDNTMEFAAAEIAELEANAGQAARLMRLLANRNRLLILCELIARKEASVGTLVQAVGLSQSAISQHLARLRADSLVAYRRDAQTLLYRVDNPDAVRILATLKTIYCP